MKAAEFIHARNSIPDAFHTMAKLYPDHRVYSQAVSDGGDVFSKKPRRWVFATYREVQPQVNAAAAYLKSLGVTKGTTVAILSGTRPEWLIADLAILSLGGITVSVYQSLLPEEVAYLLYDSEADIVFAENAEQVAKLHELRSKVLPFAGTEDRPPQEKQLSIRKIIAFEEVAEDPLVIQYSQLLGGADPGVPSEAAALTREDIAALVYTSGTTGPPKGVVQTHGNHLANVRQAYDCELLYETSSISLILPLAHSFARLMGYLGFLTPAEVRLPAIVDKKTSKLIPHSMSKDLREGRANIHPVVPRLLEKMRDAIVLRSKSASLGGRLVKAALTAAGERMEAIKTKRPAPLKTKIMYALTKPVRNMIRDSIFSPNFTFCVSGGAKLPLPVAEFFESIGLPIIEGYGLTETCVATNVGRIRTNRLGSVGPVLADDIEMRIAPDGEILYRGPNIAKGYYKRPTATKAAWDSDGWFHTGDLGKVDEDGYLWIIGRKKDLIVTSGGKNIAPHDIEVALQKCPLVSQAVLIGDGRKYCVGLVSVDRQEAKRQAKSLGLTGDDFAKSPQIHEAIWKHVASVNEGLASYETVKKIFVVPEEFSIENGQMTPTLKIKRNVVEQVYQADIDALYPSN